MQRNELIVRDLEKFKKIKYPEFLKIILIETGFDTAAALQTIEKKLIGDIEKVVNEKTFLLKGTNYVTETGNLKNTPFKFMLGHESLILRLPKRIFIK